MQVDGAYVAVRFHSHDDGASTSKDDSSNLLQDCRLLRKDELQVRKYLYSSPWVISELHHELFQNYDTSCFRITSRVISEIPHELFQNYLKSYFRITSWVVSELPHAWFQNYFMSDFRNTSWVISELPHEFFQKYLSYFRFTSLIGVGV